MSDKPYRSLLKTISWRLTGTVDTIMISFFITRDVSWAFSIGFMEVFTKLILYYFHERLWNRFEFGKAKAPDYQI